MTTTAQLAAAAAVAAHLEGLGCTVLHVQAARWQERARLVITGEEALLASLDPHTLETGSHAGARYVRLGVVLHEVEVSWYMRAPADAAALLQ